MNYRLFLIVLVVYLLVDAVWLRSTSGILYNPVIKSIQKSDIEMNLPGAIVAYLLLAVGVYYFVLEEKYQKNYKKLIFRAGLFGLLGYGIFNGTNNAILKNWNYNVSIIDTCWGITGSIIVSSISNYLNKKLVS